MVNVGPDFNGLMKYLMKNPWVQISFLLTSKDLLAPMFSF